MSSPTHVHLCTHNNCGRSFISKQALQQHMRSTSHTPPLSCRTCAKTFGSLEALDQHQNSTAHNGQSKQVLSTEFKKENVQQGSSRPPVRPVPHTRNKSCVGQLNLQKHAKPVISASVECSICKRSFCDQIALRQHLADAPFHATYHENPLLREATVSTPNLAPSRPAHLGYNCYLCVKTFKSDQALQMHLSSAAHAPSIFKTPPLKQAAPSYVAPATHIPLHYCIGCQKHFKSPEALQDHLRSPIHAIPQTYQVPGLSSNVWQEFCQSMETILEMQKSNIDAGNPIAGNATHSYTSVGVQVQGRENALPVSNHSKILQPLDPVVRKAAGSKINTGTTTDNSPKAILYGKNYWSIIPLPQQQGMLNALAKNCHSLDDLAKHGYSLSVNRPTFGVFSLSPSNASGIPKRAAVALDCEMVGVKGGRSELALLSAVDYITGEVLINTLIYPKEKVVDWRTRFSGVTPSAMSLAKSQGQTLNGWEEARAELWKHIDMETILVGHALHHDLDVLRMIHNLVVDSAILAKNAVGAGVTRQWGLKTLCKEFLSTQIQDHGKKGHDCLEDTYATREVVLWCASNEAEFNAWGIAANTKERRKQEKREARRKEREAKKKSHQKDAAKPRAAETFNTFYDCYDSENEYLQWEDVASEYGYPENYDPWSD